MPYTPKPLNSYENNQSSEVSSKGILQKENLSNYNYRANIQNNRKQNYSSYNLTNNINPSFSNLTNKTIDNKKNKNKVLIFISEGDEYYNDIDKNKDSSAAPYIDLQKDFQNLSLIILLIKLRIHIMFLI